MATLYLCGSLLCALNLDLIIFSQERKREIFKRFPTSVLVATQSSTDSSTRTRIGFLLFYLGNSNAEDHKYANKLLGSRNWLFLSLISKWIFETTVGFFFQLAICMASAWWMQKRLLWKPRSGRLSLLSMFVLEHPISDPGECS